MKKFGNFILAAMCDQLDAVAESLRTRMAVSVCGRANA
jgi:hypothetical protein